MRRTTGLLLAVPLAAVFFAAPASAIANPGAEGRAAIAPGQVHATQNCFATIDKQIANGQTKFSSFLQAETSITNCDHFWQFAG